MSGAGDDELFVTSWGTRDVNGEDWQVWRVRRRGDLVALVVLPMHFGATGALNVASGGIGLLP